MKPHEIDKEQLIKMYVTENMSIQDIAKVFECCRLTIKKSLKLYNIEQRTKSQYMRENLVGQRFERLLVVGVKESKTRVKWICECDCGNITNVTAGKLKSKWTRSCGCLQKEKVSNRGPLFTKEEFVNKANIVHNNRYSYDNFIYKGCNIKSIITCSKHGDFKQQPHNHLHGNGCPKCRMSKGEIKIENYLVKNNISHEHEYKLEGCKDIATLRFDFAIWKNGKLGLIEYNGVQHYELCGGIYASIENLKNIKNRDIIKINFCKDNFISLLVIPYSKYGSIESILEQWLSKF